MFEFFYVTLSLAARINTHELSTQNEYVCVNLVGIIKREKLANLDIFITVILTNTKQLNYFLSTVHRSALFQ